MSDDEKNILNCLDHNSKVWAAARDRAQSQLERAQAEMDLADKGFTEAMKAVEDFKKDK